MLKQGNYHQAKIKFTFYGVRREGDFYKLKYRFSADIADFIAKHLTAPNLFITDRANNGCRTIYGHCTEFVISEFNRLAIRGKANRLISQGLALCRQAEEI